MNEKLKITWFSNYSLSFVLFFLCVSLFTQNTFAQGSSDYENAKNSLVKTLKNKNFSKAFNQSVDRFYTVVCDSLINKKVTIDNKPIKPVLLKLFKAANNKIAANAISALRIPSLNQDFVMIVKQYKKEPVNGIFTRINVTKCKLLESVFDGMLLGDSLKTFNGLREMIHDPYLISSRVELPQYQPYLDTLLLTLANGAPDIFIGKLEKQDPFYTQKVNSTNNKTIKAIAAIKKDEQYDYVLPFTLALSENRITREEIRLLSLTPLNYYRAFVKETIHLYTHPDPEIRVFLKHPIADLNRKFANNYFITTINEMHESPDNVRFESINPLSLNELYFLLVASKNELVMGGSSELYTSSFLYVFNRFLKEAEKTDLNKYLDEIGYYHFNEFISNISDYGMVGLLVNNLKEEKAGKLLAGYIEKIPNKQLTDNEIILNAMTLAEVLSEISSIVPIRDFLATEINRMKMKPSLANYFMIQRMYSGFKDILLNRDEFIGDVTYNKLMIEHLQIDGNFIQACFFYDDDDAASSFNNSMASYKGNMWDKKDFGNYIVFTSKTGNKLKVYMNKPKTKIGCDSAQNQMLLAIMQAGYKVSSYIHRGHSYHLLSSLDKMSSSGQFVFLGSCGGYSRVLKVFELNPDVNIISTRNVGSKLINDPLLERINRDIVSNKNVEWNGLWKDFDSKFQSKQTKELFSGYIPPNKYIGVIFIRKVFNY